MEYINIDEKNLKELYGAPDNEMVDNMMCLMLEQTFPKIIDFLNSNKNDSFASKIGFLNGFTSSFSMVGLSAISAKIELLEDKIKTGADYVSLQEAMNNLEASIVESEILIKEYREKIK